MNFDPSVGANLNVTNDQGGLDETKTAVQSLGQS